MYRTNLLPVRRRIAWIDNIRLFAILCVILYHSSQMVKNNIFYFGWVIESFNMALFFFLSGMSSYKSFSKIGTSRDLFDFVKKKFTRILLPCIFVSVAVFQRPCSFWFCLTLFYYMIAFACTKFACYKLRFNEWLPYLLFAMLTLINIPKVGNDQEFIISFTLGVLCSRVDVIEKIASLQYKKILIVSALCFFLWLLLLPNYMSFYNNQFYDLLLANNYHTFIVRNVIYLLFITSSMLLFMTKINKTFHISKYGGETLGMYIVHVTILAMFGEYGIIYSAPNALVGIICQILSFVLLTVVTILIVFLLGKWKWTNFLVLGNKL